MNLEFPRQTIRVIGAPIDAMDWDTTLARLATWAQACESRYVCVCNAHSVVTAARQYDFAQVLAEADMATADGAPVAWMLRRLGVPEQERINGPDLMLRLCAVAANTGTPIFLFGTTAQTLALLQARLSELMPSLRIAGTCSPPYRAPTPEESLAHAQAINASGAGIVFVSLGCPKQELWMAANRGKVRAVMIGVGAAFAFHAGSFKRAPSWMRRSGLEWLHRLVTEPRRLWRRYLVTNSIFVVLACLQLLRSDRRQ